LNKAVSDSIEIRLEAARVEHADLFLGMMRALEEADPGDTPFDEARRRVIFEEFVRDDTYGRAWLILADEEPVGYIVLTVSFSFEYRGRDAFIDELYVAKEFRGRGIGRRAMDFVEAVAREVGVNAIHLEVSRHNDPAIDLYRRTGFMDHDRYLMTKWLHPSNS
jgi:diamine N-acetyltransferase